MNSNKEKGKKLMIEAEEIYGWELKTAVERQDWNLAVRRSQEIVELYLKGALQLLGIDYPKVHDVGTIFLKEAKNKGLNLPEDTFSRIREASRWLAEARGPAFYGEKDYKKEDAFKAYEDATFILQAIKNAMLKSTE